MPTFKGNTTMVTDASGTLEQHTGYYPYGEPWREPTGQPYLYGGKERMRDGALNDYDFTARRLNSALCLWSTPDPCALDYGSLNPYIYCAANPIRFTDPTGCKFTQEALKIIDYYQTAIQKKADNLNKTIEEEKVKDKPNQKTIDKLQKEITKYESIKTELNVLDSSETLYDIKEGNRGENSTITWDNEREAVVITLADTKALDQIAHEFLHAFQFENGEIDFSAVPDSKESPLLYEKTDEYAAYDRGKLFGGGNIYDHWVDSYRLLDDNQKSLAPFTDVNRLIKLCNKRKRVLKFKGKIYKPDQN